MSLHPLARMMQRPGISLLHAGARMLPRRSRGHFVRPEPSPLHRPCLRSGRALTPGRGKFQWQVTANKANDRCNFYYRLVNIPSEVNSWIARVTLRDIIGVLLISTSVSVLGGWALPASAQTNPTDTQPSCSTFSNFCDLIIREAGRTGLDPALIDAVMAIESNYQVNTIGAAGEIGLMQVLPSMRSCWGSAAVTRNWRNLPPTFGWARLTWRPPGIWHMATFAGH